MPTLKKTTLVLAALLLLGGLYGCQQPINVPDRIRVIGHELLRVKATGDQVYTWHAGPPAHWELKRPDATFWAWGVEGDHYASEGRPTWEMRDHSSKVIGMKLDDATPDATAIPWLLVKAVEYGGTGVLSRVTLIQRLQTTGGKMPVTDGTTDGQEAHSHYTAIYVFYGAGASRFAANK